MHKGPFTTAHLMRWSAAMENWHKIHYDLPFATGHDKLPGLLINGSLKQQFIAQIAEGLGGADRLGVEDPLPVPRHEPGRRAAGHLGDG